MSVQLPQPKYVQLVQAASYKLQAASCQLQSASSGFKFENFDFSVQKPPPPGIIHESRGGEGEGGLNPSPLPLTRY